MEAANRTDKSVRLQTLPLASRLRRKSEALLGRDWRTGHLFVFPMVLALFGLIGWPFVKAVYLSFTNTVGYNTGPFVGLQNYTNLWKDSFFVKSVGITAKYTLTAVFCKFLAGLLAATLLHQTKRWNNLVSALVLLPWVVPGVVAAFAWRTIYHPIWGGLNNILLHLGLIGQAIPFLGSVKTALPSVILVNVWRGIPFFTTILLAGLKSIDEELYDAAAVDGANAWRRFLHITLPGLRYVIIVCTLLSTIWTFNDFALVYLLTSGGPSGATRVYAVLAYEYAIQSLRFSSGVSVALTMAPVLAIAIFILSRYMMGRAQEVEADKGTRQQILFVISWPFRMLLRLLVALLSLLNDGLETLMERSVRILGGGKGKARPASRRTTRRTQTILRSIALLLLICFELFPFYWVSVTAFKTDNQITNVRSIFWPAPWTMEHFKLLLFESPFPQWFLNTVKVAAVTTVLAVIVSSLGAYSLVRLRWRGAGLLSTVVLITYLMPGAMMFIPLYQIFVTLGIINSLSALMVSYPTFMLPFACWLMMGYYRSIPEELEEAALIDGCNRFQAFYRIVLPLTKPALLAVALYAITQAWNEFLFAFTFITSERLMTLPVGLIGMAVQDVFPWGLMSAASLMMTIPVILIYSGAQRFMVEGLTAGAVKGGG